MYDFAVDVLIYIQHTVCICCDEQPSCALLYSFMKSFKWTWLIKVCEVKLPQHNCVSAVQFCVYVCKCNVLFQGS